MHVCHAERPKYAGKWLRYNNIIAVLADCMHDGAPTEKSHWIHMWPTCESHVFTCVPHVFQFHTFAHMWWKFFTCEAHVRSGKHMCISCVPHVTHMSPHVTTCEAHVGSYLLALRPHVEWTCEIGTTHKIHMWISCDFSVRDSLQSIYVFVSLYKTRYYNSCLLAIY